MTCDNNKFKLAVKQGYDTVADIYQTYILNSRLKEQKKYLEYCLENFAVNSRILDLGCGSGIPSTRELAKNLSFG